MLLKQTKDRKINLWRARSPGLGFPNVSPHHRKTKDWWSDTSPTWRFWVRGGTDVSLGWCERIRMETRIGEFIWLFSNIPLLFWDSRWLGKLSAVLQQYRFLWWISDLKKHSTFRSLTFASGAEKCLWHVFVNQSRISFPLKLGNKNGTSTSMNLIFLLSNLYLHNITPSPQPTLQMPGVLGGKINFSWSGNQGAHAGWRGVTSNASLPVETFNAFSSSSVQVERSWNKPYKSHEARHGFYTLYHNLTWKISPSFMQHVCNRKPGPHLEHTFPQRAFGTWLKVGWLLEIYFPCLLSSETISLKNCYGKYIYTNHK